MPRRARGTACCASAGRTRHAQRRADLPRRPIYRVPVDAALRRGFAAARAELGITEAFLPAVMQQAAQAAAAPDAGDLPDATDIPFVTVDPPGAKDLDQALHLERRAGGYRLHYAIAHVSAFVTPGSALDAEVTRRGETYYAPDHATPLHPPVLGEGAASLLPGRDTSALLWRVDLDADGGPVDVSVAPARVHSREQLTYAGVQEMLDAGRAGESLELLREAGRLLRHAATARGAVTLNLPEQQVERAADGTWLLRFRAPLPVEEWNAEMSLLVGRCAARLMLDARVGLLRALPAPEPEVVESLRRSALALGVAWPDSLPNTAFVSALDPEVPAEAALSRLATLLVRGAHYVAFDGDRPVAAEHSGVAAPYAHATAPLRRLADRHVGVICAAVCAGREPPEWVRAALPALPEVMRVADHRAHALDRAVVDVAEAVLLQDRVGEVFEAVIVERKRGAEQQAEVQLREPAVRAPATVREAPLGSPVHVRLVEADPARRRVRFAGLVG